jgi:hypothetical protein
MSFLPSQQISRVLSYASGRGVKSLAVLVPNNTYGQQVGEEAYNLSTKLGMSLSGIAYYPPDTGSVKEEIRQLFRSSTETGETMKPRFDALLIPEGGERLNQIAREMHGMGIDLSSFRILGSGQWDVPSFNYATELHGSWFASSDPDRVRNFENHFERTYGYRPPRLASLAYDVMALVTTLAYNAKPEEPIFTHSLITHRAGFSGPVDGVFRFTANGTSERGLAVLELTGSGPRVLDAPQMQFTDAGF